VGLAATYANRRDLAVPFGAQVGGSTKISVAQVEIDKLS
jgi:hypothetical protein